MSGPALLLRQQRCSHHPQREASARCPECSRFYCRECITEHDDRVLCASCLIKLGAPKKTVSRHWAWLPRIALALGALGLVYLVFLLLGNTLLSIPSDFHAKGGW